MLVFEVLLLMDPSSHGGRRGLGRKGHDFTASKLWIQNSGNLTTEPMLFIINPARFGCSSMGRFLTLTLFQGLSEVMYPEMSSQQGVTK